MPSRFLVLFPVLVKEKIAKNEFKQTTRLSAEIRPEEDYDSGKKCKAKYDVINCHYNLSVGFLDL